MHISKENYCTRKALQIKNRNIEFYHSIFILDNLTRQQLYFENLKPKYLIFKSRLTDSSESSDVNLEVIDKCKGIKDRCHCQSLIKNRCC